MREPSSDVDVLHAVPLPLRGVEHDCLVTVRVPFVEPPAAAFRGFVRSELARDLAVALAAGAFAIGRDAWSNESPHAGLAIAFDVALVVPLLWRRRTPVAVFAVVAVVAFASWAADLPTSGAVAVLIALYAVGAHESRRVLVFSSAAVGQLGVVLATLRCPLMGTG